LAILSEDGSVCVLSVSLGVCNNIKNDVRTAQLAWPALYSEGGDRLPPATIPNRGSLAGGQGYVMLCYGALSYTPANVP